jgi:hypothetical protein
VHIQYHGYRIVTIKSYFKTPWSFSRKADSVTFLSSVVWQHCNGLGLEKRIKVALTSV